LVSSQPADIGKIKRCRRGGAPGVLWTALAVVTRGEPALVDVVTQRVEESMMTPRQLRAAAR
jgi:hypothetical protein